MKNLKKITYIYHMIKKKYKCLMAKLFLRDNLKHALYNHIIRWLNVGLYIK